jgi:transcriptional antiterminator RfaH
LTHPEALTRLLRSMAERIHGGAQHRRWYLVYTKPGVEHVAGANLARQNYDVYLPRVIERVCRLREWRDRTVALFPRYLFLRLNETRQSLSPVRSSVGVSGLVRFGDEYAVVPDSVVTGLRNREEPGTGLHRARPECRLQPGQFVDIGTLDGLEGIFEREDGQGRVVVLLRLLGREVSVRIPRQDVCVGGYA